MHSGVRRLRVELVSGVEREPILVSRLPGDVRVGIDSAIGLQIEDAVLPTS